MITFFSFQITYAGLSWEKLSGWTPGVTGPSDREHPLFFIPAEKPNELILSGGLDFSFPQEGLSDTWSMNLKNGKWRKLKQVGNVPTALARVAIDPERQVTLVTGGTNQDGQPSARATLFSYKKDTVTWTTLKNPLALGRSLHALIHVTGTPSFLNFGGIGTVQGEKQLLNLTTVVNVTGSGLNAKVEEGLFEVMNMPSERYGFAYAYDARKARLIVVIGQGHMSVSAEGEIVSVQDQKTYALSLTEEPTQWREIAGAELSGRRNACWAHDRDRNYLYVFGGTADGKTAIDGLMRLNLNSENPTWEAVFINADPKKSPPARSSCVGLYDKTQNRLLFGFGNTLNAEMTAVLPHTDMWALNL